MFGKRKVKPDFTVNFIKATTQIEYSKITGFFEFRGQLYYRAKGVAARNINDLNKSFTDNIRELYPDEFVNSTMKDIGLIMVTPVKVIK